MSPTFPLPYASQDLTGQVALVTGASAGLGSRFARVLAARGAKVAIAARRLDKLEALATEIRTAGGVALPLKLDVTDADQLIKVVGEAEAQLGTVQILVNNAGIPDAQRAHKMSVELIDRVLDINVRAPWILSCEVARRLIDSGKPGRIVNLASRAAYAYDGRGAALYATSKMAVVRMTEALAVESHQCQCHRTRRVLVGDDGWNAHSYGRHHQELPSSAAGRSGATRQHSALSGVAGLGICHRHHGACRRRPRRALNLSAQWPTPGLHIL